MDILIRQHEKGLTILINRLNRIAYYLAEVVSNQRRIIKQNDEIKEKLDKRTS